MNIDNIDVFSKQSAQAWNEAYKVMLDPEINLFLSEFMNKEGLILDVGCGGGRFPPAWFSRNSPPWNSAGGIFPSIFCGSAGLRHVRVIPQTHVLMGQI